MELALVYVFLSPQFDALLLLWLYLHKLLLYLAGINSYAISIAVPEYKLMKHVLQGVRW